MSKYKVLNNNTEQDFLFHLDSNNNPVIDDLVFEVENTSTKEIYRIQCYSINPEVEDTIRISFDKLLQNSPLEDSTASEYEEVAYGFYDTDGGVLEIVEDLVEDLLLQDIVVKAIFTHYIPYARVDKHGVENPYEATLQEVLDKFIKE